MGLAALGIVGPAPKDEEGRFTRIEDLPDIDFVVISHNHYDHMDLPTLVRLAERDSTTRFFVPLENAALLRENGIANVQELDWGRWVVVGCRRTGATFLFRWRHRVFRWLQADRRSARSL